MLPADVASVDAASPVVISSNADDPPPPDPPTVRLPVHSRLPTILTPAPSGTILSPPNIFVHSLVEDPSVAPAV